MTVEGATQFSDLYSLIINEEVLKVLFTKSAYFIFKLIFVALFYIVGRKILKKILISFEESSYFKKVDKSLKSFFDSFLHIGLNLILIIMCLTLLGVKGATFLTIIGTMGLGIGLALKDSLANFAGGMIILTFNNYNIGDHIAINDLVGIVKSINIFSTVINTFDNQAIIIPNSDLITNPITNFTKNSLRRVNISVPINHNDDLELAKSAFMELITNHKKILKTPSPETIVIEFNPSSISLSIRCWVKTEDYWEVYIFILDHLKSILKENNFSIPYPHMGVHHYKD